MSRGREWKSAGRGRKAKKRVRGAPKRSREKELLLFFSQPEWSLQVELTNATAGASFFTDPSFDKWQRHLSFTKSAKKQWRTESSHRRKNCPAYCELIDRSRSTQKAGVEMDWVDPKQGDLVSPEGKLSHAFFALEIVRKQILYQWRNVHPRIAVGPKA
ncbi:hypothetical protein TNCV_403931 [Trichonephila clavipes]|nr:hypothetical protein TNCV_403931 [Trichonephila clavipes]